MNVVLYYWLCEEGAEEREREREIPEQWQHVGEHL